MNKLKLLLEEFGSLEGNLFRNSLAFSLLLALAPALTVIVMLFSLGSLDITPIIDVLHRVLPESLIDPLITYLTNKNYTTMISTIIALVTALWVASGSINSFLQISAEKEEVNISGIAIKVKSIYLFIALIGLLLGALFILSLTGWDFIIFGPILFFALMWLLYRSLSFERKEWSYGIIGAVVATLAMILFAWIFLWVLQQFLLASYTVSYGPFASFVIMILSLYIIASIIYFGYCVNEVYKKPRKKEEIKYKRIFLYDSIEKLVNKYSKRMLK